MSMNPELRSDVDLLAADADAFHVFVSRYMRAVLSYAGRRGGPVVAEDIASESF